MTQQPRLLILNGSERAGGNTDFMVDRAGQTAIARGAKVSRIDLRNYRIEPCGPCGDCNIRLQPCSIDDDVPFIVDQIAAADALIYAVPVHGFGMAEIMQRFIERAGVGYMRFSRPLANKVGSAIVTGRRYNHEHVLSQLIFNMLLNRMIIAGAGYPPIVHGGAPGSAANDEEGVDVVEASVKRVVDVVRFIAEGPTPELLDMDIANERMLKVGVQP